MLPLGKIAIVYGMSGSVGSAVAKAFAREGAFESFFSPIEASLTTWFYTGSILAKHMAENCSGTILGITANAGRQPFSGVGGFGVACAAVEHYLRQLAVENAPQNVRVCWVRSPGSPDSPGVREAWELYGMQKGMTLKRYIVNSLKTLHFVT